MTKDSRDLPGTLPAFPEAAWFDPIEEMIRDRVRGFTRTWWRRNWTMPWDARAISVLEPRMWRAVRPAIGMDGEHANCSVRLAQ